MSARSSSRVWCTGVSEGSLLWWTHVNKQLSPALSNETRVCLLQSSRETTFDVGFGDGWSTKKGAGPIVWVSLQFALNEWLWRAVATPTTQRPRLVQGRAL